MSPTDALVLGGGAALIAVLAWYFFAPQKGTRAQVSGGVQTVDITVKGGYSPSLVAVETASACADIGSRLASRALRDGARSS